MKQGYTTSITHAAGHHGSGREEKEEEEKEGVVEETQEIPETQLPKSSFWQSCIIAPNSETSQMLQILLW